MSNYYNTYPNTKACALCGDPVTKNRQVKKPIMNIERPNRIKSDPPVYCTSECYMIARGSEK